MLRFDKATYLSLLCQFILCERLSISLSGSVVLLFFKFINTVFIFYYSCIECIILLYSFLVTSKIYKIHLVTIRMYYLLLLVQLLFVFFEALI